MKENNLDNYAKEHNKTISILGLRNDEGGRRSIHKGCLSGTKNKVFTPLKVVSDEWEMEFIKREKIEICNLYKPPYNFKRTGCKGCPFNKDIFQELETMYRLFPKEYKQCLHLWKPVYDEYIRIGYRMNCYPHERGVQMSIFDYVEEIE